MKITPLRTMLLEGEHVEQGKPVAVSKTAADLAIRHGWAVATTDAKAPSAKAKAVADDTPPDAG